MTSWRRSRWDRQIARLAVPAFGALIAEPLYVLTDTAIVGHLGTTELGGLAVAATVLLTINSLCVFLAYGTTSSVARLLGAGSDRAAAHEAVQGLWLATALGLLLAAAGWPLARPLVGALADDPQIAAQATIYLRLSLPGIPALLIVLAGTGYLRGLQDTRTPLLVAIGSALINLVLEVIAIYGFGLGLGASATATVVAQWSAALTYLAVIRRSARATGVSLLPSIRSVGRLLAVGGALVARTAALRAVLIIATALAARRGATALGAHQIAFELWSALALALDALAIAGQALVGRLVGAGDLESARAAGRRMLQLGLLAGLAGAVLLLAGRGVLPHLFTDDPAVVALTGFILWHVAALQPVNSIAFVLDGLLIGAGDHAYLARAMVGAALAFAGAATLVALRGWGIGWLWAALGVFMIARAVPLALRWRSSAWFVQQRRNTQSRPSVADEVA